MVYNALYSSIVTAMDQALLSRRLEFSMDVGRNPRIQKVQHRRFFYEEVKKT